MKPTVVVDSNIVLKWVVSEPGSDAALDLRERYSFTAPDLLVAECANALWKRVRRGEMTDKEAVLAVKLVAINEMQLEPMQSLAAAALELAVRFDHPVYDCLFLSLAIREQCAFVTADDKLLRKLEGKSLPAISIAEALAK